MFSGHTDLVRRSPLKSPRGRGIESFIIHHAATTDGPGVVGLMVSGARQVSSNYVIYRDGTVAGVVDEEERAWTSGSKTDGGKGAAWDRKSITFECANLSTNGWTISDATYESVSDILADAATRYGIDLNRNTVVGHRELFSRYGASYATACPGSFDLDRLVNMARAKQGKGALPAFSGSTGAGNSGGVYKEALSVREYQTMLISLGYNLGSTGADGVKGAFTSAAVTAFQRSVGLEADNLVGPNTVEKLTAAVAGKNASPAPSMPNVVPPFPLQDGWYFGPRSGPVSSVSGYYGHRDDLRRFMARLQERGYTFPKSGIDGLYGDELAGNVEHFQRDKGLTPDRLIGEKTWRAAWEMPIT